MRRIVVLAIAVILATGGYAQAAWEQFVSEDLEFGADFPSEPTRSEGTYQGAVAGERHATIFEAVGDDVIYRTTIVDITDQLIDSASILEEAVYIWGLDGNIIVDSSARADPWQGAVYGRRVTIDKPDGSRATASFFVTRGRLYLFEASVPAGGDLEGPDPGRFVQSVVFNLELDWSVWPPVPRTASD